MIRLTTMMMGPVLLLAGCGQGGIELMGPVDPARAEMDSSANTPAAKSQIVRALLQAIDEIKGESPEVKEELRRSLLSADDELAQVLGDAGRQSILNANKKPAATIIGRRADPSVRSDVAAKPSAGERRNPRVSVAHLSSTPADDESDEPKTEIIKALLAALDESDGDDDDDADTKQGLKQSLMQADSELSRILGDNSKRLIQQANKKPLVPMIRDAACPPEKEPTENK